MKYYLYIKSHTTLPDYEDEVEADNIVEALAKFGYPSRFPDWDVYSLLENISCETSCELTLADKIVFELLKEIKNREEEIASLIIEKNLLEEKLEKIEKIIKS